MAGLFGLFNYDKVGPGIPKNGPKKKTFVVFFETFFRNIWKFITMNVIYTLMCIPAVTSGMANVGLTNVCRNTARDKHSFGLSDFFETIKKNLKQSIIAGIINTVVTVLLVIAVWYYWATLTATGMQGTISVIGLGIVLALSITFIMMNYYLWTLIITFSYTLKQAYSISFKLVFLNFKYSFLCLFINALILASNIGILFITGTAWIYALLIEILLLILIYPGFNGLLIQFCTFPSIRKFIIDPYYKEHPGEDIEKRKRLGLEIEEEKSVVKETDENESETEDDEDEDDTIFND